MKDTSMYYDVNKTLARNRLFNFVVGNRGVGKTYACKKKAIQNYLKYDEQFVYLRRYETEMPSAEMRNFFDDVSVEFPDIDFKSGKGLFRINNSIAGWYFPLSKATMLKSIPFPNVSLIIFDEFIIEVGVHHYLPSEVRSFLECYSTISRDRDVKVLFLSNAITMTNPYFIYFDLTLQRGQTLKLTEDISLEVIHSPKFEDHMNKSRFGRLVAGTEYGKYAIQNKFLLDNDVFVEQLPPGAYYISTLTLDGIDYGVYTNQAQRIYISHSVDKGFSFKIALSTNDHSPDSILALRKNYIFMSILDAYYRGEIRFTKVNIKNIILPFLKKTL